ncbi:MAG: nitrous oxide reductase accessory protein NosL [Acidobacteriota bacterium]|jgi:nitrous oxide reductase accessory protein NosL
MDTTVRNIIVTLALIAGLLSAAAAADLPRPPTDKDRCAVCGMYVHKYPNWIATIVFEDGSQVFFDGPKDFFRYALEPQKFKAKGRKVAKLFVTDYYGVKFVDATTAYFVAGSDVMGPMGPELIPLRNREEAETFARDHGGGEVLAFDDVTPAKIPR